MASLVKTLLYGLTDPEQAREAGLLGIDAALIDIECGSCPVSVEEAIAIAAALPPLTTRLARVAERGALPPGFSGAVTPLDQERPLGTLAHIVEVGAELLDPDCIPFDVDAIWMRAPAAPLPHDWNRIERFSRRWTTLVDVDGSETNVEVAIRLGRPYAIVLGEGVWFGRGICDMDRLEAALAAARRASKALI